MLFGACPIPSRRRKVINLTILLGLAAWVPRVEGEPGRPPLGFDWTAPAGCPSREDVVSELDRLLGDRPGSPATASLAVTAQVTHDESWRVTLGMTSPSDVHTRTVQAQTCRGLADATALILAMMIDPDIQPRPRSDVHAEAAAPPPEAGPEKDRSLRFGPALGGETGALPRADVGVGVQLALRVARVDLTASVVKWLRDQTASAPDLPGAGGRFSLYSGALGACRPFSLLESRVELGPCALFEAGRIDVQGFGVTVPRSASSLWLAPGAGALALLQLSARWSLQANLDGLVPLRRPRFLIQNGGGSVYRSSPVVGRVSTAVMVRF